jgi:hypothetical protein
VQFTVAIATKDNASVEFLKDFRLSVSSSSSAEIVSTIAASADTESFFPDVMKDECGHTSIVTASRTSPAPVINKLALPAFS